MKKDEKVSEEQLNAFVDGELESEDQSRIFNQAAHSDELERRLCRQRKLKELVRHAYRDVPEPPKSRGGKTRGDSRLRMAAAAALLLAIGASIGQLAWDAFGTGVGKRSAGAVAEQRNYLLHLTSGEASDMRRTLKKAESLLAKSSQSEPRQVEIVANEQGLNLLRSDLTQFSDEISALAEQDVVFYACSRAVRLLEEKGIEVLLVPEANAEYSALERVVERMQDGWQYIKI